MQNGAETSTCAQQTGAIIYLLSSFNMLFRSECSSLGYSVHLWDTLFISGYSVHLWTLGFSWMPHIWDLMVLFDPAWAKLFSHFDNLHFWLALENLIGNLVIDPEGSAMSFKSQVKSLPLKFQVSGHVWAQSNELSLSLFVCQISELSKLVFHMQIYKMNLP